MQALKGIISSRVSELEEMPNSQPGNDEMEMLGSVNDTLVEQQQAASCTQQVSDHQQKLFELQSQIHSLCTKQRNIENQKEKETRKCNILIGNVDEEQSESATQAAIHVFKDKLNVDLSPVYVTRLGKLKIGQRRPILVRMRSFEEKLTVLKKGKLLSGSGLYISEDLSKEEREKRKVLVNEMNEESREESLYQICRWPIDHQLKTT